MFGIADYGALCAAVPVFLSLPRPGTFASLSSTGKGGFRAGVAYLAWMGLKLLLPRGAGAGAPVEITPGRYARQAFVITLLNPKAIVFYMAFLPLFIDPAAHPGLGTFAAMAATIAVLAAAYCLTLCAFAQPVSRQVKAHRRLARWPEPLTGLSLVGFGLRLVRS